MSLHERWTYDGADPAIMLFTAALKAWQLPIRTGQRVLELGCNESPFLSLLAKADPSLELVGVDARPSDAFSPGHSPEGWSFVQGSAWDQSLFEPASFDWVLLLGALEHFGLGYYGDPRDPGGDKKTIDAIARWLKPGGKLYFDVPCNPEDAQTAHFRTYAPESIRHRLGLIDRRDEDEAIVDRSLREIARGYSLPEPTAGTWVPQPTVHLVPYHFVAIVAEKA